MLLSSFVHSVHTVAGMFESQGTTVFWQSKIEVYCSYRSLGGMGAQIASQENGLHYTMENTTVGSKKYLLIVCCAVQV